MLKEYLKYIKTSCPAHIKKMGYLKESIATGARYERLKEQWQPHIEKTMHAILASAQKCKKKNRAVVLGSGHLHDVPIAVLARQFKEVVLVDVVHPEEVKELAQRMQNVKLVEHDITGVVEKIYPRPSGDFAKIKSAIPKADYIVSVNILSQLPQIPAKWLGKKKADEKKIKELSTRIIKNHIDSLKKMSGVKCLITDYEFEIRNKNGGEVEKGSLLHNIKLPKANSEWIWDIAPAPEIDRNLNFRHKVAAFHL